MVFVVGKNWERERGGRGENKKRRSRRKMVMLIDLGKVCGKGE